MIHGPTSPIVFFLLALVLAPFLLGVINRTKAFFGGRCGQPLLQAYYDIHRLFKKGAVYSRTVGWVFRLSPVVGVGVSMGVLLFMPFGSVAPVLSFAGDMVALFYLMGLARFLMISAALDTASAFEGMGASREALFSALAEPALFIGLAALVRARGSFSLAGIFSPDVAGKEYSFAVDILIGTAFFLLLLSENSRIPVDDPQTHLELTMIHEVMVLDHSGPDFGLILYASSLKMWFFCSLTVHAFAPGLSPLGFFLAVVLTAVGVGIAESTLARVRMNRVTQFITAAGVLNIVALILVLKG